MKSPMAVRNARAPVATPSVFVGRMIETIGRLRSRNGHGSGMIKFFLKSSLFTSRSGNVTDTPVTGSTAVSGGALPALSDHVWKCMVSVGPMLIRFVRLRRSWLSVPWMERGTDPSEGSDERESSFLQNHQRAAELLAQRFQTG